MLPPSPCAQPGGRRPWPRSTRLRRVLNPVLATVAATAAVAAMAALAGCAANPPDGTTAQASPDTLVCDAEAPTGSHIRVRRCRTAAQAKSEADAGAAVMDGIRSAPANAGGLR